MIPPIDSLKLNYGAFELALPIQRKILIHLHVLKPMSRQYSCTTVLITNKDLHDRLIKEK